MAPNDGYILEISGIVKNCPMHFMIRNRLHLKTFSQRKG